MRCGIGRVGCVESTLTAERDRLRAAYRRMAGELELLRRRIFVAKAERLDSRQLEIEFAEQKAELAELAEEGGAADGGGDGDVPRRKKGQRGSAVTPKGRRDLRSALGSMNPRRKGILRSSRTPLERSREPTRPK